MKYCWKDDEVVLSIFEIVLMEVEVEDEFEFDLEDGFLNFFLGERFKWGWLLKGVGFWFKVDSILNSDFDWDEIEERRWVKFVVKKKKGWVKKGKFYVDIDVDCLFWGYSWWLVIRGMFYIMWWR